MDIVEEIRTDRERGAKRLEAEYRNGLLTLARRFCHDPGDAAELVNRTFAEVIANIDNYAEQSAFFGWMSKILVHIHSKDVRRMSHDGVVYPGTVPDIPEEDSEESVYRALDASLLRDAINTLPDDIRETLLLHYFMDLPVAKVAKILSVPNGTVKWRLHYAREILAAKMGAAVKKPCGKATLIALLLCAVTALGAGTRLAVVRLLSSPEAATEQQVDNPLGGATSPLPAVAGSGEQDAGSTATTGETSGSGGSSLVAPDSPVPPVPEVPFVPEVPSTTLSKGTTMNTTTLRTIAASAAFAAASAAADLPVVHMTTPPGSNYDAFTNARYWGDGTEAPHDGADYVIANNYQARVPEGASTFAGHSLQIGETGGAAGTLVVSGNATKQSFAALILAKGSCVDWRSGNKSETIAGPVTVTAPQDAPFTWSGSAALNSVNSGVYFEDSFSSETGTKIVFADNGQPDYHVDMEGSLAAFAGTLEMRTSRTGFYTDSDGGTRLVIYPGSGSSMPGALAFGAGTSLVPSDKTVDFSIGSLNMAAGSRILVKGDNTGAHSIFRVTGSFDFPAEDGGVLLEVSGLYKTADTLRTAIFSAPVSSGFTAATFRTAADDGAAAFPRFTLECEDADGVRTLYLVTRIADPAVQNGNCLNNVRDSNTKSLWSSGVLPTADSAANHDFYDSYCWIQTSDVDGDKSFYSSSTLTLGGSAELAIANYRLIVSEFGLLSGAKISSYGTRFDTSDSSITSVAPTGLKTVKGTIRAPWKNWETANLVGRAGAWLRHDGTLTGGGIVYLHNTAAASDAYYQLRGSNTGFFGALKLGTDSESTGKACLVIDNAANLGGTCKAFRADALTLATGWKLWPRASMSLAEPTRGITVAADGVINVGDGVALTVTESILWNGGGIEKTGAGTLALGGAAAVASGAEYSAALTISGGAFKPLSTNALAGVSLAFGAGASMRITVPAADDGMRDRGVSPAAISLPQGGVAVEFDVDAAAMASLKTYRVAILTLPSESASAARAGLSLASGGVSGFGVRAEEEANNDGTTTIFAKFGKGTMILFR